MYKQPEILSADITIQNDDGAAIFDEVVKEYNSYTEAAKAACNWVNSGSAKINPKNLVLYKSRLKSSKAYGKVVGVGLSTNAGAIVPYVRLDMDNAGKGIHFNATQLSDNSKKFAGVIKSTVGLSDAKRETLYLEYIKALENRSAEFLWHWWSTGSPV